MFAPGRHSVLVLLLVSLLLNESVLGLSVDFPGDEQVYWVVSQEDLNAPMSNTTTTLEPPNTTTTTLEPTNTTTTLDPTNTTTTLEPPNTTTTLDPTNTTTTLEPPIPVKNIWAVLVAGSNGFDNYRHQADVCHAYQILVINGVPRENIIVMMYDDIANNSANPTPGVIINRPNGPNVYEGIQIDYRGEDVTPDIFKKVLLGDGEALKDVGSGKVLQSGPDDHVFVNFVDHGAPGLVCFPLDTLYARDLVNTLKQLHHANKYAKLVFYLEACESGSMFQNLLPPHWNIFATTASNDEEGSSACYWDDLRNTYLGDVYSVMWMENADKADLDQESLQDQFLIVRNETDTSHVMEYGDKTLCELPVSDFLGDSSPETRVTWPPVQLDAVESGEVVKATLERRLAKANTPEEVKMARWQLKRLHENRKLVQSEIQAILSKVTGGSEKELHVLHHTRLSLTNWDCYEQVTRHYSKTCFSIAKNPYVTRKLYLLVNMCERGWEVESITAAMTNTCQHSNLVGVY